MKKLLGSLLSCLLLFVCACSSGETSTSLLGDYSSTTSEKEEPSIAIPKAYAGETVDLLNENLRDYFSLTEESKIAMFLRSRMGQDYSISQSMRIEWDGGKAPYVITLAKDLACTQKVQSKTCYAKNYYFDAGLFLPGHTYYYKVTDADGEETEIDSFTIMQAPRIMTVSGVKNVRDIGGWKTEDGRSIAYGKLFRGAHVDDITEGGKETLWSLGIKTDLDFRTATEANNATKSPVSGLLYERISITLFDRIFEENAKDLMRKAMAYFSDESHYPIYYHCRAGADRTGTITFLLNGLCGVSFEDLTKDFELTSFFGTGSRWRSAIEVNAGVANFTEDGIMNSAQDNYVAWNKLYMEMMSRYGQESGKLSDAIASYLLDIGVTETQIENIRGILLGEPTI